MNKSTVLPQICAHAWALPVFILKRSGTVIETSQTSHPGHAASTKTTRLSLKDC